MQILLVSDLHYTLKQLDWVTAVAGETVNRTSGEVARTIAWLRGSRSETQPSG